MSTTDGPTFRQITIPEPFLGPDGKPAAGAPCRKCGGPTQILFAGPGGWSDICNDEKCGETKEIWLTETISVEEARRRFGC